MHGQESQPQQNNPKDTSFEQDEKKEHMPEVSSAPQNKPVSDSNLEPRTSQLREGNLIFHVYEPVAKPRKLSLEEEETLVPKIPNPVDHCTVTFSNGESAQLPILESTDGVRYIDIRSANQKPARPDQALHLRPGVYLHGQLREQNNGNRRKRRKAALPRLRYPRLGGKLLLPGSLLFTFVRRAAEQKRARAVRGLGLQGNDAARKHG